MFHTNPRVLYTITQLTARECGSVFIENFFYTKKNKSSIKGWAWAVSTSKMPLANGTWVEFTSGREMSNGEVEHLDKITGVVVDSWVKDGVGYYTVQHYENGKPGPEPSLHGVRDDPLMIRELPNLPPLRVLPERAAAIAAEVKMREAAKRS